MTRFLFTSLVLLGYSFTSAQFNVNAVSVDSVYVLNGDTISGYILEGDNPNGSFTQLVRFTDHSPYPMGSIHRQDRVWFRTWFSGSLLNGKRIGQWKFWHDAFNKEAGYNYCGGSNQHTVQYSNDTVTYSHGNYFNYKIVSYANDSTSIFGKIGQKSSGTEIEFRCVDQCSFWSTETKDTLLTGSREEFNWLLMTVEFEYLE